MEPRSGSPWGEVAGEQESRGSVPSGFTTAGPWSSGHSVFTPLLLMPTRRSSQILIKVTAHRASPSGPWEASLYQRQAMSRKHGGKTLKTYVESGVKSDSYS